MNELSYNLKNKKLENNEMTYLPIYLKFDHHDDCGSGQQISGSGPGTLECSEDLVYGFRLRTPL